MGGRAHSATGFFPQLLLHLILLVVVDDFDVFRVAILPLKPPRMPPLFLDAGVRAVI